jgi:hypothetical protein
MCWQVVQAYAISSSNARVSDVASCGFFGAANEVVKLTHGWMVKV